MERVAAADPGQDQGEQDLLGGVRGGGDGVGREDGQRELLGKPLLHLLGRGDRPAEQDPLDQSNLRSHLLASPMTRPILERPTFYPSTASVQAVKTHREKPPAAPTCGGRPRDSLPRAARRAQPLRPTYSLELARLRRLLFLMRMR